jgi:hypothetical protein
LEITTTNLEFRRNKKLETSLNQTEQEALQHAQFVVACSLPLLFTREIKNIAPRHFSNGVSLESKCASFLHEIHANFIHPSTSRSYKISSLLSAWIATKDL